MNTTLTLSAPDDDYQVILGHFNGDPAALNQGLQPVFLYTDEEGEDVYSPRWFFSHKGLKDRLSPPQNALLAYLFLDMQGDAQQTLTCCHSVLPLADALGIEPA